MKRNKKKNPLFVRTPHFSRRQSLNSNRIRRNYLPLLGALGWILLVFLGKVKLQNTAKQIGMDWEKKNRQLQSLNLEIENLRVEREHYLSGEYIYARAAELGLRPPEPGQVRLMTQIETQSKKDASLLTTASPEF